LAIADVAENKPAILPIDYRPFDQRFIPYTGKSKGILAYPRHSIMQHIIGKQNICLALKRQAKFDFTYAFVHKNICESCLFESAYANNSVFPLYLYPDAQSKSSLGISSKRIPNLNPEITQRLAEIVEVPFVPDDERKSPEQYKEISPLDVLDYVYAILHSPTYRDIYKALLRIDFPRVPYPINSASFWELVGLGKALRLAHLLENSYWDPGKTRYPVKGSDVVERVEYLEGRVHINGAQYFENVTNRAWNFEIGGYQVCEKWLKDRKRRTLSSDDIVHYQKMVNTVNETIELMEQVDTTIKKHGGWSVAFKPRTD
jgi:predicted helicase